MSLFFAPPFLLPPPCGFAVKGDECGLLSAVAGSGGCVGFLDVVDDDAGVNLGGVNRAVAQKFLNVSYAGPAAEHFGGAAVAEAVDGVDVADTGPFAVLTEGFTQVFGAEQKEGAVGLALFLQYHGAHFPQVLAEEPGGDFAHGDLPVLAAFALDDADGASGQVEVVGSEAAEFAAAQSAGVKEFEDGPVPEALGRG